MKNKNTYATNERFITVTEDDDGQRLDRWIKKNVPDMPYGFVQKLIRKGAFKVDSKRAKPDTKLSAGQQVRIPPAQSKPKPEPKKLSDKDKAFIRSLVIYDDGYVIALNKPHGLAVQGGSKQDRHIDGMLDALTEDGVRPRLVHRLDKDTSGVLLLARSSKMASALGDQFKGRSIKKIYWAVVTPTPEDHAGSIKAPLAKSGGLNRERMHIDEEDGKFALTEYEVLEHAHTKAAFVAFWPRTGRTHQIRVHAELMGCPILGDNKYRGQHIPKEHQHEIEEAQGIDDGTLEYAKRLHLHAHRIICKHPKTNDFIDISAPLPDDLKKSWRAFGFNPNNKANAFQNVKS